MTIEATATTIRYAGGDQTLDFAVPFPVLAPDHLGILVTDADGEPAGFAQDRDYRIVALQPGQAEPEPRLNAPVEYRVVLEHPLPAGWILEVRRLVPLTQEHLFHNQGPNLPYIMELSLDKLTMICQELRREVEKNAAEIAALRENAP